MELIQLILLVSSRLILLIGWKLITPSILRCKGALSLLLLTRDLEAGRQRFAPASRDRIDGTKVVKNQHE